MAAELERMIERIHLDTVAKREHNALSDAYMATQKAMQAKPPSREQPKPSVDAERHRSTLVARVGISSAAAPIGRCELAHVAPGRGTTNSVCVLQCKMVQNDGFQRFHKKMHFIFAP